MVLDESTPAASCSPGGGHRHEQQLINAAVASQRRQPRACDLPRPPEEAPTVPDEFKADLIEVVSIAELTTASRGGAHGT